MVMGLEMQHNTNIANHIASTMSIPCKRQHVGKQIPDPQLLDGKLYYYTTCHMCDTSWSYVHTVISALIRNARLLQTIDMELMVIMKRDTKIWIAVV